MDAAMFELDPTDLKLIAKALDTLSLSETAGLLTKVQAQIDAQTDSKWDELRSAKVVENLR